MPVRSLSIAFLLLNTRRFIHSTEIVFAIFNFLLFFLIFQFWNSLAIEKKTSSDKVALASSIKPSQHGSSVESNCRLKISESSASPSCEDFSKIAFHSLRSHTFLSRRKNWKFSCRQCMRMEIPHAWTFIIKGNKRKLWIANFSSLFW